MKSGLILSAAILLLTMTAQGQNAGVRTPEALIKRNGCMECHNDTEKSIGPAFQAIAARYATVSGARDSMKRVILNGSKAKWEASRGAPMPDYRGRLSENEAASVAAWILKQ